MHVIKDATKTAQHWKIWNKFRKFKCNLNVATRYWGISIFFDSSHPSLFPLPEPLVALISYSIYFLMPLNYLSVNTTYSYRNDYGSEWQELVSLEHNFLIRNYEPDPTTTRTVWKAM